MNGTPTTTARAELHSMITFHHANTRGSRAAKLRILHIFVSLKQLSSMCHVSFLAAPDTDHKRKFYLTHLIHFSFLSDSLTSSTRFLILDIYPSMFHGRVADQHKFHLSHYPCTTVAPDSLNSFESQSFWKVLGEALCTHWWRQIR